MPDLFEIVDAGFERAQTPAVWRCPTPDGREATVVEARLRIGAAGESGGSEYWYATAMSAVLAAARWIETGCRGEPDGWTRDSRTGRRRPLGTPTTDESAWVCPRHPDRLPVFERGRLWCQACGRHVADAIAVPWPPPGGRRQS